MPEFLQAQNFKFVIIRITWREEEASPDRHASEYLYNQTSLGKTALFCFIQVLLRKTFTLLGFPGGSDGKESTCNAGDLGSTPGLGRSPGGGHAHFFLISLNLRLISVEMCIRKLNLMEIICPFVI